MLTSCRGSRPVAEFIYDRDQLTIIVLRVPRDLWQRWEFRHRDFGVAIHALREHCIEVMSVKVLTSSADWQDKGDPFYRE